LRAKKRIFALLLREKMVGTGFLFTRMKLLGRIAALIAARCLSGEFRFSGEDGFTSPIAGALWPWRPRLRTPMAAA
jgi:hypothetical protein